MRAAVLDATARPKRNLCPTPRPSAPGQGYSSFISNGGAVAVTYPADGGAVGTTYHRLTVTTVTTGTGWSGGPFHTGRGVAANVGGYRVQAGLSYAFSYFVRRSVSRPVQIGVEFWDEAGTKIGATANGPAVTVPAATWIRLSVVAVPPAGATRAVVTAYTMASVVHLAVGETLDDDGVMVTEGATLLDYSDGSTPGWRWLGTAGASESAGYPYTLESIAGTPLADLSTPSTIALSGATSTNPLTLYLAGNRLTTGIASWADNSGINPQGSGISRPTAFVIQQSGAASASAQVRLATSGNNNQTRGVGTNGTVTAGRHVFTAQVGAATTELRAWLDGSVSGGAASTTLPGIGVERYQALLAAASATFAPDRLLVYEAQHDDAMVARIAAWLARRYGAPVPAGY